MEFLGHLINASSHIAWFLWVLWRERVPKFYGKAACYDRLQETDSLVASHVDRLRVYTLHTQNSSHSEPQNLLFFLFTIPLLPFLPPLFFHFSATFLTASITSFSTFLFPDNFSHRVILSSSRAQFANWFLSIHHVTYYLLRCATLLIGHIWFLSRTRST